MHIVKKNKRFRKRQARRSLAYRERNGKQERIATRSMSARELRLVFARTCCFKCQSFSEPRSLLNRSRNRRGSSGIGMPAEKAYVCPLVALVDVNRGDSIISLENRGTRAYVSGNYRYPLFERERERQRYQRYHQACPAGPGNWTSVVPSKNFKMRKISL